jgi:hypothetical protein
MLRQRMRHDADVEVLPLQHRALLDMQLVIGAEFLERSRVGHAGPADPRQLLPEFQPGAVGLGQHVGLREDAHGGARAHHGR